MYHIQNVLLLLRMIPNMNMYFTLFSMFIIFNSYYNIMNIGYFRQLITSIKNLPLNACYYTLYMYSVCSIKYNKVYSYVSYTYKYKYKNLFRGTQSIYYNNIIPNEELNTLEFYDNKLTNTACCYGNSCILNNSSKTDDTLIIFTDKNYTRDSNDNTNNDDSNFDTNYRTTDNEKCFNKVIFYSYPTSLDYTLSNIQFIAIDLHYANKSYSICLKNKQYNYYIVNNCLNKYFFKYYLKNILNVVEPEFDYKLTLVDQNVNIVELTSEQCITIYDNDYRIDNLTREQLTPTNDSVNDFVNVEIADNDTFTNYYTQIE